MRRPKMTRNVARYSGQKIASGPHANNNRTPTPRPATSFVARARLGSEPRQCAAFVARHPSCSAHGVERVPTALGRPLSRCVSWTAGASGAGAQCPLASGRTVAGRAQCPRWSVSKFNLKLIQQPFTVFLLSLCAENLSLKAHYLSLSLEHFG